MVTWMLIPAATQVAISDFIFVSSVKKKCILLSSITEVYTRMRTHAYGMVYLIVFGPTLIKKRTICVFI